MQRQFPTVSREIARPTPGIRSPAPFTVVGRNEGEANPMPRFIWLSRKTVLGFSTHRLSGPNFAKQFNLYAGALKLIHNVFLSTLIWPRKLNLYLKLQRSERPNPLSDARLAANTGRADSSSIPIGRRQTVGYIQVEFFGPVLVVLVAQGKNSVREKFHFVVKIHPNKGHFQRRRNTSKISSESNPGRR